jgi:peptide deformylase
MFVDHLSSLKRELIRKRMKRLKADRAAETADEVAHAPKHESAL